MSSLHDDLIELREKATQGRWNDCSWDPMERPHLSLVDGNHHGANDIAQNMRAEDAAYVALLVNSSPDILEAAARVVASWDCILPLSYEEQEKHAEAVTHLRVVLGLPTP